MLSKFTFVLGGAASGKSLYAESLVTATGAPRVYIATGEAWDDEMRAKIAAHVDQRGPGWRTLEAPLDLAPALASVTADEVALLDCATMWMSNHLLAENSLEAETARLLDALAACKGKLVVVSNEVGMGIVPENALARRFRDAQGRLNKRLAAAADTVLFVAAGLPLTMKAPS
ncbi:MAG: bifunctional adenosylcobinamide kinase/adenosylcobinamide-phosphate guanylyltransferase [Rhodobacteraceae bacterium]|nr:bifunctional adenosylcobinamide kinase/adenosylcobinamide-phosphate guanylyltransferase [Paracoccaceae bacterium]MCW9043247.1 bifunctional adenosylcobinamide kinase/adenosylcobinamide-phosphate guanylyltransferase [Pseudopelagicola sp.]